MENREAAARGDVRSLPEKVLRLIRRATTNGLVTRETF